ncbi:hypothetical protein DFH94DRAFT_634042 [Russula ochroleuca]|uniref:Cytochrome c oxidase assembly protein COX20, mitochondrial n=1 Tax=Russula ochroleuca TaxID=152965 RepID=A0A9P5T732_9AGAM|nr:hypothetical protein DFH94DRAFT_634042 [Russula ochroleuca]
MSTSPPERNKDTEDPNPPPGTHSPTPRRPIYQTETTGNYWADVREAFKRVGEIPCARNSLLNGIASGVGVGVIRGLSVHPLAASHWAVGTFMLVSLGDLVSGLTITAGTICQQKILEERQRVQTVVEQLPKRVLTKPKDSESPS